MRWRISVKRKGVRLPQRVKTGFARICKLKILALSACAVFAAGYPGAVPRLSASEDPAGGAVRNIAVEVSLPENGTAVFEASANGASLAGVEIRLDGNSSGTTDWEGKLAREWIMAGAHEWQAIYQGNAVKKGGFTVPEVVEARITDRGAVMNDKLMRDGLKVRPFMEDWTGFVAVKNTGTTFIDQFRISFACPMEDSKAMSLDLISPPIPSWLWRPFVGDMLSLCTRGIDFMIQNGQVEMSDTFTSAPIAVKKIHSSGPLRPEGLAPGETIFIEYTEPYRNCVEGFVQSIGARKNMKVETEIVDAPNGVMHMVIHKYRLGIFTFDRIVAELIFRGVGEAGSCSLELSIGEKLQDSVPWVEYEWF